MLDVQIGLPGSYLINVGSRDRKRYVAIGPPFVTDSPSEAAAFGSEEAARSYAEHRTADKPNSPLWRDGFKIELFPL